MKIFLATIAAIAFSSASFGTVSSFNLTEDESSLSIKLSDGATIVAPKTNAEQVAFGNVKVSPKGQYIGWTVAFSNCCTSYPLPRSLVIHDGTRVVRIIEPEDFSIFTWSFSRDGRSFVYKRELPHGSSPRFYHWIRIQDGKTLGEFECLPDYPDLPSSKHVNPPRWAHDPKAQCAI
jgi:hypothetical protein